MSVGVANPFHPHPYLPSSLQLTGWQPLVMPFTEILLIFFGGAGLVALFSYTLSGRAKHLSRIDRTILTWWVVTGVVHFVVEGWVVAVPRFFADTTGNPLSEIWKEYAKADSRYASRDSFTISMEFVTAFLEGPSCFVVVYSLLKRKPWRHILQVVVATCQVYGDILYFATSWYEGWAYTRPDFLYFWFYFVVVNFIWIIIPSLCAIRAAKAITKSVTAMDRVTIEKQQ